MPPYLLSNCTREILMSQVLPHRPSTCSSGVCGVFSFHVPLSLHLFGALVLLYMIMELSDGSPGGSHRGVNTGAFFFVCSFLPPLNSYGACLQFYREKRSAVRFPLLTTTYMCVRAWVFIYVLSHGALSSSSLSTIMFKCDKTIAGHV